MHQQYSLLMSSVLDGEASSEERGALERHLNECAICTGTWARFRTVDASLSGAVMMQPAPDFSLRVLARLEASRRRHRRRRLVGSGLLLAWGGIFIAMWAVIALIGIWGVRNPEQLQGAVMAGAQVLDGVGELLRACAGLWQGLAAPPLALLFGLLTGLAAVVGIVWFWLVVRHVPWLRPAWSGSAEAKVGVVR